MEKFSRRDLFKRAAALSATLAGAVGNPTLFARPSEPHLDFPTGPRDRLAVASYPFRAFIERPGARSRDRKQPGMDLEEFAGMVVKRFNVRNIEPLSTHFRSLEMDYVHELRESVEKAGAHVINIPVDELRSFYDPDAGRRKEAVRAAKRWVDIAAAPDEIERAYRQAAEHYHPDAFAGQDLGDLEELLVQILDKLNAAYRVLSNEEKRKAYLAFLLQRHAEGRRKPDVDPEAEMALKRGERALRAHRIREAIRAFQAAAERNPREPEYLAMLAFATLRDPALEPRARPRAAARVARRALALDHGCVRAMVTLALAEESEGDVSAARRRLLGALRLAPGSEVARRALQRVNRPR